MRLKVGALLSLCVGSVHAHPGHGQADVFHTHGDWLLLVALIAGLLCWKLLRKP